MRRKFMMLAMAILATPGMMPAGAAGQTAIPAPAAARETGAIVDSASSAESAATDALDDMAPAPAAAGRGNRILSANEAYNLGRAAEGRVGLRVGNDMRFRVQKRAGTP